MTLEMIIGIAAVVVLLACCVVLVCLYLKDKTKDEIRKDVYKLILGAEKQFLQGQNLQKFMYVVSLARSLLPKQVQVIVTVPILHNIFCKLIQEIFDEIKDVMDDGKRNKSAEKQEV